jgi:kumamolisin
MGRGLSEAVHGKRARPNVIVMTWGLVEEECDPQIRKGIDAILQDAVRLGITVVVSSGDHLATDGLSDQSVHVDYPASSPYVLSCGGTQFTLDLNRTKITDEVVWNDRRTNGTGGGISQLYAVPSFQNGAALPVSLNDGRRGRGVPDVAALAGGTCSYRIVVGNQDTTNGGTSAVAPLWGAFIALLNEQLGASLGFVNSRFYQTPSMFNPITSGDNAHPIFTDLGYSARPDGGWNACTGLGTPNGAAIIAALTAVA